MTPETEAARGAETADTQSQAAQDLGTPDMGWMPRAQILSLVRATHLQRAEARNTERNDADL